MSKQKKTSNKVVRNEKGQIISGTPNPNGRPKGALGFATKWRKFIEKVAEEQGVSADTLDENLLRVAYKKAATGDYSFYRDIHDRVYGKPQLSIDHTTNGKDLQTNLTQEQQDKLNTLLNSI